MTNKFSHVAKMGRNGRIKLFKHDKASIAAGKLYQITPRDKIITIEAYEYEPECFFCASKKSLISIGNLIPKKEPIHWSPSDYICLDCLQKLKHARKNSKLECSTQSKHLSYYYRCSLDKSGGFILPREIRCKMKIAPQSQPLFTQVDNGLLEIRFPYCNHCFFCGSEEVHLIFKNTPICKTCLEQIKRIKA